MDSIYISQHFFIYSSPLYFYHFHQQPSNYLEGRIAWPGQAWNRYLYFYFVIWNYQTCQGVSLSLICGSYKESYYIILFGLVPWKKGSLFELVFRNGVNFYHPTRRHQMMSDRLSPDPADHFLRQPRYPIHFVSLTTLSLISILWNLNQLQAGQVE